MLFEVKYRQGIENNSSDGLKKVRLKMNWDLIPVDVIERVVLGRADCTDVK